jgi:p-hydroxybenzoate 3-monooxygenase
MARAIEAFIRRHDPEPLNHYTDVCLRRIWQIERFSWWMTSMMHKFDNHGPFDARMQTAELNYILNSAAGQVTLAENYVGLPLH